VDFSFLQQSWFGAVSQFLGAVPVLDAPLNINSVFAGLLRASGCGSIEES